MNSEDVAPRKVSMGVFVWAIGTLITMMGIGFQWTFVQIADAQKKVAAAEARVQTLSDTIAPLNYSLGQIQRDIDWIKQSLTAEQVRRR